MANFIEKQFDDFSKRNENLNPSDQFYQEEKEESEQRIESYQPLDPAYSQNLMQKNSQSMDKNLKETNSITNSAKEIINFFKMTSEKKIRNFTYEQLVNVNSKQFNLYQDIFLGILFPLDQANKDAFKSKIKESKFYVNDKLRSLFRQDPKAREQQIKALKRLLDEFQITMSNDQFFVNDDFTIRNFKWIHSGIGRKNFAQVVRSLYLLGSETLAINLRNFLIKVALRYNTQLYGLEEIAIATRHDFWAIRNKINTKIEIENVIKDISYPKPDKSIIDISQFNPEFAEMTGNKIADFMIGHIPNEHNTWLYQVIQPDYFISHFNSDSHLISLMFPIVDSISKDNSNVYQDLIKLFELNPLLVKIQSVLADMVLVYLGLERNEHFLDEEIENIKQNSYSWLNEGSSKDVDLLIRVIINLKTLNNINMAQRIVNLAVQLLDIHNLSHNSKLLLEKLEQHFPQMLSELQKLKQDTKIIRQEPEIEENFGLIEEEDYDFLYETLSKPTNGEIYANYLRSKQFQSLIKVSDEVLTVNLQDLCMKVFPLDIEMQESTGETIFVDESLTKVLLTDFELSQRQLNTLTRVLKLFGLKRNTHNEKVKVLPLEDFTIEHELFSQETTSYQKIMTRLLRSLTLTGMASFAKSLQLFVIDQGIQAKTSPITLVHWLFATEYDYVQRVKQLTINKAKELIAEFGYAD